MKGPPSLRTRTAPRVPGHSDPVQKAVRLPGGTEGIGVALRRHLLRGQVTQQGSISMILAEQYCDETVGVKILDLSPTANAMREGFGEYRASTISRLSKRS